MQKSFGFSAVVCLIFAALPLAAQNASLAGTVKDQQGGVIPNAAVTLTSADTGVTQAIGADSSGNFEFPAVRPATYAVKVVQKGFQTYTQTGIVLAVDERRRLDVVMQVGDTSSVVTVESQSATVSTESSTLGSVVENKKIVEIPLNGRFFLDLALLQTGTVVPSTNNRTFLAAPSGIGISGEDLPHVFERFYRASKDRSRKVAGVGLGLSIAQSIVQRHGGELQVQSVPGEGSAFRIVLPAL